MPLADLELWLVGVLLASALALPGWRLARRPGALICAAVGLAAPWAIGDRWREARPPDEASVVDRPIQVRNHGYVSSDACQACHPAEYGSWYRSYHRSMTQPARPGRVLGDFDGAEATLRGRTYRMFRRGDDFFVERPAGERGARGRRERKVVMTTGSHHYQLYWLPSQENREVELFEFAWRIPDQRWIPLDAIFISPPGQRHSVQEEGRWNTNCVRCHTTLPHEAGDGIQLAEFGIGCEACHGPGLEHVEANRNPLRRLSQRRSDAGDATIVNPAELSPERGAQVCGQCHGLTPQRVDIAESGTKVAFFPGDDLFATRTLFQGPDPQFFWPDGVVRVSGREFNGLAATPCYAHGDANRGIMTCLTCHEMHPDADDTRPIAEWRDDQLVRGAAANATCLDCHADLSGDAALAAHTHHDTGSSGSECINCHMPHSTYGLLKAMRSHTIESPDVRVDVRVGRPNACNLCHLDRSLGWTASHLSAWYGRSVPPLDADQRSIAAGALWALRGDAGLRALAAWSMGWPAARAASAEGWMEPVLAQLLADPYTAVRYIANQSLQMRPGYASVALDDVMLPPQERERVRDRAWELWEDAADTSRMTGKRILVNRDGTLARDTLLRLVRARDRRPVALAE